MAGLLPGRPTLLELSQRSRMPRGQPGQDRLGYCTTVEIRVRRHFALVQLLGARRPRTIPCAPSISSCRSPAGDGTDAMARSSPRGSRQRLGQPFIIENRPGRRTSLAAADVARPTLDGYTCGRHHLDLTVALPASTALAYDPAKDFSPISLIAAVPFVLIVHPGLQVDTVAGPRPKLPRPSPGR